MAPPSRCSTNVWTIDHERRLIEFFEERKFLWHLKDPDHMNRNMRNTALQDCIILLGINDVNGRPFTIESLKGKFTNLRTTFQREMKRVEAAKRLGIVHTPKWNLFAKLLFLKAALRGGESSHQSDHDNESYSNRQSSPDQNNEFEMVDNSLDYVPDVPQQQQDCSSNDIGTRSSVLATRRKRTTAPPRPTDVTPPKKGRKLTELLRLLERASASGTSAKEQTPEDVFGQHLATSLKAIPSKLNREKAKLDIQKVIYQYMFDVD